MAVHCFTVSSYSIFQSVTVNNLPGYSFFRISFFYDYLGLSHIIAILLYCVIRILQYCIIGLLRYNVIAIMS